MYLASLGYDFQMCHVLLNVGLVLMFLDVVRWFFFVYNHLVQGPGVWDLSIFYSFPTTCFILFPFVSLHPYPVWRPRVPGLPPANLRNFQSFPGAWMRDSVQHSAWAFQNGIPTSEQMDSHSLGTYLYYIREPWMWRMMDWSDSDQEPAMWWNLSSGRVVSWSERFHAHAGPALASQGRD